MRALQRAGSLPAVPAEASATNERAMRTRARSIVGVMSHLAATAPAPETKKAAAAPVPKRMTMAERNEARYQELLAARQRRAEGGPAWSHSGPASSSQVTTDWLCEFQCGFSGTFDEVLGHEKTCVKRPAAGAVVENLAKAPAEQPPSLFDLSQRSRIEAVLNEIPHPHTSDVNGRDQWRTHWLDEGKQLRRADPNADRVASAFSSSTMVCSCSSALLRAQCTCICHALTPVLRCSL
jgi:hypothetical protein